MKGSFQVKFADTELWSAEIAGNLAEVVEKILGRELEFKDICDLMRRVEEGEDSWEFGDVVLKWKERVDGEGRLVVEYEIEKKG